MHTDHQSDIACMDAWILRFPKHLSCNGWCFCLLVSSRCTNSVCLQHIFQFNCTSKSLLAFNWLEAFMDWGQLVNRCCKGHFIFKEALSSRILQIFWGNLWNLWCALDPLYCYISKSFKIFVLHVALWAPTNLWNVW